MIPKNAHLEKIKYLGSDKSIYTLDGIYCLAQQGNGRPHAVSTATWECSSLARHTTYPNSLVSQPTAPLGNKGVASGLGVAACTARDPTPVNHMRPWNWVRKGREMKGAGIGVFGFVPNFKTTGSAKRLSL